MTHAPSLLFLISISFCVAFVTSQPNITNFLQCLPLQSKSPDLPILEYVYTQNNSSFVSKLQAYIKNQRFMTSKTPVPLAIIAPKTDEHIQAIVICAKSNGLQIRTRSGGHDYEGLSYTSNVPYIVIDLFNQRNVFVQFYDLTAIVQTGATLGDLYYRLGTLDVLRNMTAFPAGVCHTIGTGGHFSGGGYGNLMRKYGISSDNIIDAKIVDANGRLLDRKAMGEDLFWAIRGGGGGSFGVITEWTVRLVDVPPKVTVFNIARGLDQGATDIVYKWQQVAPKLDNDLFIRVMPKVLNGTKLGEKKVVVSFIGMYLGLTDPLLAILNKSFPELGLKREDCKEMTWVESTLFWEELPEGTPIKSLTIRPEKAAVYSKLRTDYVKDVIPKSGLEAIWKWMIKYELQWMQWNPYGGRMSEIPEDEIPFPHRAGILFLVQYASVWHNESDTERYMDLSRKMFRAMTPYVSRNPREAAFPYRDIEIGSNPSNFTDFKKAQVYGQKFFKGNFIRLAKIKAKVDPDNFFKNEQSIPPLFSS